MVRRNPRPTELLLDDLQNLLLVKLLGKTLNSSQSLTTIALCETQLLACTPLLAPTSCNDSDVRGTRMEKTYAESEYGCSSETV